MNNADEGQQSAVPIRTIHQAYRACIEARWGYIRARKFGGSELQAAHFRLHDAVQEYFEAMHELLAEERSVREFWQGNEQYHLNTWYEWVVETDDGEQLPVARIPPEKFTEEIRERAHRVERYTGLYALEGEFSQTEQLQRSSRGLVHEHHWVEKQPRLLPPDLLFAAARLLNQAAKKLGLSVEIDDRSLPAISGFDQSGEKPTGELVESKYNRTPDL